MKVNIKNKTDEHLDIFVNDVLLEENYIELDNEFNLRIVQKRLSASNRNFFKTLFEFIITIFIGGRVSYGNELVSPAHAEWNGIFKVLDQSDGVIEIMIKVCDGSSLIEVVSQNLNLIDYTSEEKVTKSDKIRWLLIILCFLIPWSAIISLGISMMIKSLINDEELNNSFFRYIIWLFVVVFFVFLLFGWIRTLSVLKVKSSNKKNIVVDGKILKADRICKRISNFGVCSSVLTIFLLILGPFVVPSGAFTISIIFNGIINIICCIIISNIKADYHISTNKNQKYIIRIFIMLFLTIAVLLSTINFYSNS